MRAAIVTLADDAGQAWIHAFYGVAYAITPGGGAAPLAEPYAPCEEAVHVRSPGPGLYRPSLLVRDVEALPRLRGTDVVVQGTWRSDHPVTAALCTLTCAGAASFRRTIALLGDRVVDRGRVGPVIAAPRPFTELPIRLDRAFGGTDEAAAASAPDPEEEALRGLMSDEEFYEVSTYSYPPNPAGRGYVVDPRGLVGASLPNLEWPDDRLTIERMAAPLDRWGEGPRPACFDLLPHAFFPRAAFFGAFPPTHDGRTPRAEVALGILAADAPLRPLLDRPSDAFFQSAQPHLWQHRLRGDEALCVTGMSADGRDTAVRLPGLAPRVDLRVDGRVREPVRASLDVVHLETERARLTLIWRASFRCEDPVAMVARRTQVDASAIWDRV